MSIYKSLLSIFTLQSITFLSLLNVVSLIKLHYMYLLECYGSHVLSVSFDFI